MYHLTRMQKISQLKIKKRKPRANIWPLVHPTDNNSNNRQSVDILHERIHETKEQKLIEVEERLRQKRRDSNLRSQTGNPSSRGLKGEAGEKDKLLEI